ncbi:MAG: hypothetical protein AB2541_06605 [Candidatus Thiodiazotropha sp.]
MDQFSDEIRDIRRATTFLVKELKDYLFIDKPAVHDSAAGNGTLDQD